jgi:hypothetical protein
MFYNLDYIFFKSPFASSSGKFQSHSVLKSCFLTRFISVLWKCHLGLIVGNFDPVHNFTIYLSNINFNLFFQSCVGPCTRGFATEVLYALLLIYDIHPGHVNLLNCHFYYLLWAGIAQLVWRLLRGWTTEGLEFESRLSRFLFSPCRPDRLWGPPSLLYNGYRGLFPRGKAAGAWSWPLTSS